MSHFGIDLLLESQKQNIRSRNDVLVILMHWLLCKNDLRNVGVGDDKNFNEDDRQSELLPEGWNSEGTTYTLRYTINKRIIIFHASVIGSTSILFNLLDAKTLNTKSLVFETSDVVKATVGNSLDDFVENSNTLIDRMSAELVEPVLKRNPVQPSANSSSPLIQPSLPRAPGVPSFYNDQRDYLWDIGRSDLDPLGRGGGGMIFNPRNPFRPGFGGPHGLFPSQPFPQSPRYDPPSPLLRFEPDNSHLPPPGLRPPGYDDMFM